jgi:spore coat polysaccharide biosynthesis protein SpsF
MEGFGGLPDARIRMPNVIVIIQARTGSTRLPGKVLLRVCGKTLLQHQLERVKRAATPDGIVVATTNAERDTPIAAIAKACGAAVYRGSEQDVLDRFYRAAQAARADVIVRITADCPCMDPEIIDAVVRFFLKAENDYVSNVRPPTFPDGMDVEVFTHAALEQSWREARLPSEREHVTAYIATHPECFRIGNYFYDTDLSEYRLTVDEPADWELIRRIFESLIPVKPHFALQDIIELLTRNPEFITLNKHIAPNEGYQKSLLKDAEFLKRQNNHIDL